VKLKKWKGLRRAFHTWRRGNAPEAALVTGRSFFLVIGREFLFLSPLKGHPMRCFALCLISLIAAPAFADGDGDGDAS